MEIAGRKIGRLHAIIRKELLHGTGEKRPFLDYPGRKSKKR